MTGSGAPGLRRPLARIRWLTIVMVAAAGIAVFGSRIPLPSLRGLPSPSAVHGDSYRVRAQFGDVLNLPDGAKVKVNGATIGEVTKISTRNYLAELELRIGTSQRIPRGSTAQIRFSTPLGEQYVALTEPANTSAGYLGPGDLLSRADTSTAPTIEDTFSAVSALLNGGSLEQIGTLTREFSTALGGNAQPVREMLATLDGVVSELEQNRQSFDRVVVATRDLSAQLATGQKTIDQALITFPDAIAVLADQRTQLHKLVKSVHALSQVSAKTIEAIQPDMIADIRSARVIVASLAAARSDLAPMLRGLTEFGARLDRLVPGDYLNADATVTLDWTSKPILPSSTRAAAAATARPAAHTDGSTVVAPASGTDAIRRLLDGSGR